MKLNTARLMQAAYRILCRQARSLKELASKSWIVDPGQTVSIPPAIFPDRECDKIKGLSPWRSWETEKLMIFGGELVHGPTVGYEVEGVTIAGSFIYTGSVREKRGFGSEKLLLRKGDSKTILKEATLVTTRFGSHYFGTCLQYDFPLALLAKSQDVAIKMSTRPMPHVDVYRELCSLPPSNLVGYGFVRKLTIFEDHTENESRAERYRRLRANLRRSLEGKTGCPPVGVFIRRGRTGERRILANEAELEELLTGLGFVIVDPEYHSALDIALATLDAKVVISVEGSQISHAIYSMADHGTLLVLQPPDRFSTSYKEFTDRMNMNFAFLVGYPCPGGFSIATDQLISLLAKLI